ncbi:MAG: SIMPL domain-containing protein [Candidatus Pacebacteria bacterium]|nr:SIMPL domain-containing protein [Candidatus Paceibacterota bacterium]
MNQEQLKVKAWKIGCGVGGILIALIAVLIIKELASISHLGDSAPVNTINVNGTGDAYAIPNIATFSFTVSDTEKTVALAQTNATAAVNSALVVVRASGVADKDIQTEDYSISPQYVYQNAVCPSPSVYGSSASSGSVSSGIAIPTIAPAPSATVYCPPNKQTLTGYQVSESISVKLRDLTKAGSLLASLGSAGVTDLSGPSFTVDNPDSVQAQARSIAIADAQSKAEALAKQLGVRIVRVTSFNDNNNGVVYPMMAVAEKASTGSTDAATPEVPVGQQKVTDNVSISYEIQ